ncbi:lipopolysaccharide biosynthesis protein [Thalassotalea sp. M1531]|uniref:Lipopolysaccharide biosynthesis protein n=2 Tax=Thalassotalea algicola TaxID=2716224 RepID=A0A7Y0Q7E4_9GAMM|nr:lipopolysaccharide biosynthesis protein [Thalassotalea algicola]
MKGVSLVMLPVYTHYLSPEEYGRLEVIVVFSNLASIFLGFGLVEALYRYVGLATQDECKKQHAAECLLLAVIIAAIAYIFFHFFSSAIALYLPGNITEHEIYLLGVALALGGVVNVPLAWVRITARAGLFFKVTMAKVILQVAMSFYWLTQGLGVESILASGAISTVVIACYLCQLQYRETGFKFSTANLKSIVNYGWPILIGGAATFALAGLDRWLLAEYFGAEDIATYAIALKFALVPVLLIQPFTLWWYPKRFSVLQQTDGVILNAKFATFGAVLAVSMCALLGLIGPILIQWLTPREYHHAANLLPGLLLCTSLKLISELLNLGCYIDANSQKQMVINMVASVVGALLLFVLIPNYHVVGAIASLLVAYSVRTFLFYFHSQRRLYLPYKLTYLFSALSAFVLITFIGQHLEAPLWLAAK